MQGMNPYAYVGGNPETYTDPTGNMYAPPPGSGGDGGSYGGSPGTGQNHNPTPPPVDPCSENSCSVTLNHHIYSLAELKKKVQSRKSFLQDFYTQFDPGYGNAELAFLNYLYKSGRLSGSTYWKTVDFDVMRDQLLAAYDELNRHKAQSGLVTGWLSFLAHPTSGSWWAAHNGSINAGDKSARADGLFAKESSIEQGFINETIHVLGDVQSLSNAPGIGSYFSPQSSGTATLTSWFYPQQYNDGSTGVSLVKQGFVAEGAGGIVGASVGAGIGGAVGGGPGAAVGAVVGGIVGATAGAVTFYSFLSSPW